MNGYGAQVRNALTKKNITNGDNVRLTPEAFKRFDWGFDQGEIFKFVGILKEFHIIKLMHIPTVKIFYCAVHWIEKA